MRYARARWAWAAAVAVVWVVLGSAWAQDRPQEPDPKDKDAKAPAATSKGKATAKTRKGGLRAPGGAAPKRERRGDPLAKGAPTNQQPKWPFHWKLKIAGPDGHPLGVTFYPSRAAAAAAVIMLVHDRGTGHSSKDFEEPIAELKDQGLADHLQELDYAVLALDLRGHGANPRRERELSSREWQGMVNDLQAAYMFLVDRHNRREVNLSKFGVIGVGEGSNLAAAWAASAGGAVSSEGRVSDLNGLVLVSPVANSLGLSLATAVNAIAPRVPIMLLGGERDTAAANAVKAAIERQRLSRVSLLKTRLQGDRLLRFEPKVVSGVTKFIEEPVKFRNAAEWEPRYLFTPIAYTDVELVAPNGMEDVPAPAEAPKAKAKAEPPKGRADAPKRK